MESGREGGVQAVWKPLAVLWIEILISTRPKPAYGRQGLDWIVGPGYSFVVFWTNRGIKLTSYGAKTSHHQQGDLTDLLWCKNVTLPTGRSNWPPLVQKRDRYQQGGPTDLLDVKIRYWHATLTIWCNILRLPLCSWQNYWESEGFSRSVPLFFQPQLGSIALQVVLCSDGKMEKKKNKEIWWSSLLYYLKEKH